VRLRDAAAIFAAGILVACGAGPHSSPAGTPEPTKAATGPRVRLPSGAEYAVELALTDEERAQGLMFRESLPPRTGMLFLFEENGPHHFWMKNTMISLDMIWMDGAGTVLFISADTPPCTADPCANYGPDVPARRVLEIAGGKAKEEGVVVGSKIEMIDIKK
jgi:uncharacterized membrane protein (UPF0127 family)